MQISPLVIPLDQVLSDSDAFVNEFAHSLAQIHNASPIPLPGKDRRQSKQINLSLSLFQKNNLLGDLHRWDLALRKANALFKSNPARDAPASRASEWMLDNFYILKQTLRQIEEDLPASFLNELPKLTGTVLRGHSRIFALAQSWVGYNHGLVDLSQTAAFMLAYQHVAPLTIGELWALPVMLRIVVLEQLVYAAAKLTGMEKPKGISEVSDLAVGDTLPDLGQSASPAIPDEAMIANCFLSLRL